MKAKFSSKCISCGEEIGRGKEISKNTDGQWVHNHCVDDSLELP